MDFSFTPEQDEAAALAAQIIGDHATNERMKQVEAAGDRFDRDLWSALDDAGLLSLHLPEEHGGAGLGLIELARVLVEVGRRVAPLPLAAHGPVGLALAEAGTEAQRSAWLGGGAILTAAISEESAHLPEAPGVTARADGDRWALDGVKTLVRAGMVASAALVTASTPEGVGVFLLDLAADGVTRAAGRVSDGDVVARLELAGAPAERVEIDPARFVDLVIACSAAEQLGITDGALALTSSYAKEREQFNRPIGTFQAVRQRLADGFIDVLAQRLTLWQAVWRLSEGLPASTEVASAKLWAADAGHRLAHTTVHVHGGVGIDLDGEAHRYFTSAKRFEFAFGGATDQALRIGRALAEA